jgi:hypothetical protein
VRAREYDDEHALSAALREARKSLPFEIVTTNSLESIEWEGG